MSKMSDMNMEICTLLDTTMMSSQEIADQVGCPLDWVDQIVEQRWADFMESQDGKEFERGFEDAKHCYQGA
jgi:hypothetical protein